MRFHLDRLFYIYNLKEKNWTPAETKSWQRHCVQSFPDDWKFNPTKRVVLKAMLKFFDPIGFIAPFSVRMKSLLQETWKRGLEWDEKFPNDLKIEWENWCAEIEHLHKFEVSLKYFPQGLEFSDPIEIHIFSYASPKAYGAVAYFRYITSDNEIMTSLIWAKCRDAPLMWNHIYFS